MPTRSASCKASAPDRTAYPVSSNSLLDRLARSWYRARQLEQLDQQPLMNDATVPAVVHVHGAHQRL